MSAELLSLAWSHRFNSRIEETKNALNLLEKSQDPNLQPEVLLLKASLARYELDHEKAFAAIEQARQILQRRQQPESFQLHMQTALCLIANARHVESLRSLQKSEGLANGSFEKLLAKVNIAICCFNLNLPHAHLFREIEKLLVEHPASSLQKAFEQLKIISLKRNFHQGLMHSVFESPSSVLNQSLYFQALVASLPWNQSSQAALRDHFIQTSLNDSGLFQSDYRLQTILADSRRHELEDLVPVFQLQVDRLYLWTWQWLVKPSTGIRTLLEDELANFPFEKAHLLWTDEDFLLLESAMGWLGLFNSRFAEQARQWISKHAPASLPDSWFFEVDRKVRNQLAGKQEISALSKDCRELQSYLDCVRTLMPKPTELNATGKLIVDLNSSQLFFDGKKFISQPATDLVAALKLRQFLDFSEALTIAYSISGYDSLIHGPKINNLLQRIKGVLPKSTQLKSKNQCIYLVDPDQKIQIVEALPQTKYFPQVELPNFEKKQTVQKQQRVDREFKTKILLNFASAKRFSRLELQECLGIPKPTATRLLRQWLADKTLETEIIDNKILYRIR